MQKVLYPKVELYPIDVVEENIEETIVKRWIFSFKVRSYSYTPAPMCIDATQGWIASNINYDSAVKELTRKDAQLVEMQIAARTQFLGTGEEVPAGGPGP